MPQDHMWAELLHSFAQLEKWIPGCGTWPVDLLFGKLPEANPADIYRLADAWGAGASRLNDYYLEVAHHADPIIHHWQGDGAPMAFQQAWINHLQDVSSTSQAMNSMQQVVQGYGLQLETEEFFVAFALIQLLVEAIIAIVGSFFSFGGSLSGLPLAIAAARVAIKEAFDKCIQAIVRLGEMLATGELKRVLERTTVRDLLEVTGRNLVTHVGPKLRGMGPRLWDTVKDVGPRTLLAKSAGEKAADQFRKDVLRNAFRKELTKQLREQAGKSLAKKAEAHAALRALDKGTQDLSRLVATEVEERLLQKWTSRAAGREVVNLGEHATFDAAERLGQHELANSTRAALDAFVREQVERTTMLGAAGRHVGELAWAGVKFMGGAEVGAQGYELLSGERTSFDPTEAAFSIGQGALMGGMMFGHGVLGKMATGGLAGVATAAATDGGQLLISKVTGQHVDINWSADLKKGFSDGVHMGFVFSAPAAAAGLASHVVPHFGERPGREVFSLNDPRFGSNVWVGDRSTGAGGYISEYGGAGYRFADGSSVHLDPFASHRAGADTPGSAGPAGPQSSTALLDRPAGGGDRTPHLTGGEPPSGRAATIVRPDPGDRQTDSRVPVQRTPEQPATPAHPDNGHADPGQSHPDPSDPGQSTGARLDPSHPGSDQTGRPGSDQTGHPGSDHGDTARPTTAEPDTGQPAAAHPDGVQPGSTHPDGVQPGSTQPNGQPGGAHPDGAQHQPDEVPADLTPHPTAGADGQHPATDRAADGSAGLVTHPVDTRPGDERADDGSGHPDDPTPPRPAEEQPGAGTVAAAAPRVELPVDRIAVRQPSSIVDGVPAGRSHADQVRAAAQDRHAPAALKEQHETHLGPTDAGHPAHSAERIGRVVNDLALTGRDAVSGAHSEHSTPLGHDDSSQPHTTGHDGGPPDRGSHWVEAAGGRLDVRDEVTALLFRDVLDMRIPGGLAGGDPHLIRARAHELAEQILAKPEKSLSGADVAQRLREYVRTEVSRTGAAGREHVERTATDRIADEAARQAREQHSGTSHEPGRVPDHEPGRERHRDPMHEPQEHRPASHDDSGHDPTQHAHEPGQHQDAPVPAHEPVRPVLVGEPRPESTRFERHFMELKEVTTPDGHVVTAPDGQVVKHWVRVTETIEQHWTEAEYERLDLDNLEGGLDGPQAREAAHRAAQDLAQREYRKLVEAADRWAEGDGELEELARVGGMSAATVLPDGRVVASTSVRTRTPRLHEDTGLDDRAWQRLNSAERAEVARGAAPSAKMARRADATRVLPDPTHPLVRPALDGIPENLRSTTHGKCAEPAVLSKIARTVEADFQREVAEAGGPRPGTPEYHQRLAERFADTVRDAHIASHRVSGEPMERSEQFPCSTDDQLIDHFGLRSDYVDHAIAQAHIDPQRGLVILAERGDPLRYYAMHLPDLGPDHVVVVLHGEASSTGISARIGDRDAGGVEVARVISRIIEDHPDLAGRKIVLVTCEAAAVGPGIGSRETSLAAQVVERTGATVIAARTKVAVSEHGDIVAVGSPHGLNDQEHSPHGLDDQEHSPPTTSWVEVRPGEDGSGVQVRDLSTNELPFTSNPHGPTGHNVYADTPGHSQPGYGYSHEANAIYGTRFVPDGRSHGRLTDHELLEAAVDTDLRDFGGRVSAIEREGFQLKVVDDNGQEHHFRVEIGDGMRNVAGTTLHAGTVHDPHVVTVNSGVHGDVLPRVWLHEITETLDERALFAEQPEHSGMLGKLFGAFGGDGQHAGAPHPGHDGPTVSESHVNARLAERRYLMRHLADERLSWHHEDLRNDIRGLDRELAESGYDTTRLDPVPESSADPHDDHWTARRWEQERRRISVDEAIPENTTEAARWAGAQREALASVFADRDFGGMRVRLADKSPVVAYPDGMLVRLEVLGDRGDVVGSMSFTLSREADGHLVVSHDSVGVNDSQSGQGFYRQLNAHLEGWYRESGVDVVKLRAASSTGGYVHAREGTDWDPEAPHDARKVFTRLHSELTRLAGDAAAVHRWLAGDTRVDIRALAHDYRANDPHELLAEIERQRSAGTEIYERARRIPFGREGYPTPREVADAGRPLTGDTGRDRLWVGKRTLLGADWHGVKTISHTGPLHTRAEHASGATGGHAEGGRPQPHQPGPHDPTGQHPHEPGGYGTHEPGGHSRHDPVPVAEAPRPEALMPDPEQVYHELRARGDEIAVEQLRFAEQLRGDGKYWFTKVYHYVTVRELAAIDAGVYRYPTMKLQEVAAFHEAWKVNMEAWLAGDHDRVEPHWREAFAAAEATNHKWYPLPSLRVLAAIQPSLEAHIRFDLPRAIVYALDRFYGDTGIGQSEFRYDYDRMGRVFDEAAAALRPEIADHTFVADPGQYGLAQRIGQEFLLKVPTTREHTWQKVDWIIRLRDADITEPLLMHGYLKHQSAITFGHTGAHDYRIGGREIENFRWLDQPEPDLPAARHQLPDPGQITAASVRGSAQFHGLARAEADPHTVGQLARTALDRALDERPLGVPVEITTTSPHQADWPGDAVARSIPVDAHGNDLQHSSVPPPDGGWRIEVSDRALDIAIPRAVAHEVDELGEIQARLAAGEPIAVPDVLHRGDIPADARLSPHDVGRLAERGVLREQAGDHRLRPEERAAAHAELANLDGELGLSGEDRASAARRELVAAYERERASLFPRTEPDGHPLRSMVEPNPREHLLPEAQSREIFETKIVRRHLLNAQPQDKPVVVFVASQPGGGKTKTQEAVEEVLASRGGSTAVSGDLFRPHHPQYKPLMAQDDKLAAFYTSEDARRWNSMALDFLARRRCNVFVETTLRDPESFKGTVEKFREAGFRVELMILAVPGAQSRLGILERYNSQLKARGTGRMTATSTHDKAYDGILTTAQVLDEGAIPVDVVAVVRRGNELVFANERGSNGEWVRQPAGIRDAVAAERTRPWTERERAEFTRVAEELREQLPADLQPELSKVVTLGQSQMAGDPGRTAVTATGAEARDAAWAPGVHEAGNSFDAITTGSVVIEATRLGSGEAKTDPSVTQPGRPAGPHRDQGSAR